MAPEEWIAEFGPFGADEEPIPYDLIPATVALRDDRPFHGNFRICAAGGVRRDVAASTIPIVGAGGDQWRNRDFLARGRRRAGRERMRIKVWGARGSIPAPGPETMRYGGNTSCVELTLSDGSTLILDAGTGIRNLGLALRRRDRAADPHPADPPAPRPHPGPDVLRAAVPARVGDHDLGPRVARGVADATAIARYISAPLAPVEVRELPSDVSFREAEALEWEIGSARVSASRGQPPRADARLPDRRRRDVAVLHPRPRARPRRAARQSSTTTGSPASSWRVDATMLIHDCQYTDAEYATHVGWGHSPVSDALSLRPSRRRGARPALPSRPDAQRRLPRRAAR